MPVQSLFSERSLYGNTREATVALPLIPHPLPTTSQEDLLYKSFHHPSRSKYPALPQQNQTRTNAHTKAHLPPGCALKIQTYLWGA